MHQVGTISYLFISHVDMMSPGGSFGLDFSSLHFLVEFFFPRCFILK